MDQDIAVRFNGLSIGKSRRLLGLQLAGVKLSSNRLGNNGKKKYCSSHGKELGEQIEGEVGAKRDAQSHPGVMCWEKWVLSTGNAPGVWLGNKRTIS